jgi:hypothetical protein
VAFAATKRRDSAEGVYRKEYWYFTELATDVGGVIKTQLSQVSFIEVQIEAGTQVPTKAVFAAGTGVTITHAAGPTSGFCLIAGN